MLKNIVLIVYLLSTIAYGAVSEFNTVNKNDFFVTVSGGWGYVSDSPHNTGVVTTTLGYFFQKNISAEFRYLGYFANHKKSKLDGNSYLGLVKYNYKFFDNLKAGIGIGLGIGDIFKEDELQEGRHIQSGLIALPISLAMPSGIIENMDFIVTYLYVKSFKEGYANFITSGISYNF